MTKWILGSALFLGVALGQSKIESIKFVQEGEVSKLIINLDSPAFVEKNVLKNDKQIILDLKNTVSSKQWLRPIDTSQFKGSTVLISPYKRPGTQNDLRFAIQLRDNVRSTMEKAGNRIILKIENRFGAFGKNTQALESSQKVTTDSALNVPKSAQMQDILQNLTQAGAKKYVGKRISVNVNDMSYTDLLKIIAETSGFNIIIDEEVNKLKPITLNLSNVPWDQALDTVLDLGSLVATKRSNILTIQTIAEARKRKLMELESEDADKIQAPLVTKVFPISHANLPDLSKIITGYLSKDRGRLEGDQRTNQIIVTDTVETIERIKGIVRTLDTQEPQVLIEAKIVEAEEGYEFRAGLASPGVSTGYQLFGDVPANSGTFSLSSVTSIENPVAIGAAVSVFNRLVNLNFDLQLMESERKGKIVTAPKVITENNQTASITNTLTRPFKVVTVDQTGARIESFQNATADIKLDVTPKVTNEGAIALTVNISKAGFGTAQSLDAPPPTSANNISTKVLVDNGSTVVIGGLYKTENRFVQSGIPYLKDIPILGWLFKTAHNPTKERSELIVFITPRVINQEEAGLTARADSGTVE